MNALSYVNSEHSIINISETILSSSIEFDMTRNTSKFVKIVYKPSIVTMEAHANDHAYVLEKHACHIIFGMIINWHLNSVKLVARTI